MAKFYIHKQNVPMFGEVKQLIMVDADGIIWWVPNDEGNSIYQQYLAWLSEGNEPEEWNPEGE